MRREAWPLLVAFALALAAVDTLFGAVRPNVVTSTLLLSAAAFAAGGRTLVASAHALSMPAEVRAAIVGLRAATMQLGYFAGSIAGGAALVAGGYAAFGVVMGSFFLAAAAILACVGERRRTQLRAASHAGA